MSAVVNIHKDIIPWICSIADPMAVSANAADLKAWEDGKKPTVAQVDKMSRALRVPFGYFFLSSPQKIAIDSPAFRTLGSKSKEDMSPDLRETVSNMEVIQEWLKDEIVDEGLGHSPIAGIIDIHDDVLLASNRLKELLGLETDWYRELDKVHIYPFLREKAGDNQVFIFENGVVGNNSKRVLDLEEFRAFALYDENAPVVFINARDNAQAKAFSLLHELVHMASGQNDLMEGTDIGEEGFCNSIAAEIMAPGEAFKESGARKKGSLEKKIGFSGGFSSRLDHNFLSLLFASVHEGRTRYTEACRLTGCNRTTFERLVARNAG